MSFHGFVVNIDDYIALNVKGEVIFLTLCSDSIKMLKGINGQKNNASITFDHFLTPVTDQNCRHDIMSDG